MNGLKARLSILFVLFASAAGFGQRPDGTDGTILLGEHYGFILKEPNGWIMDGESGKSQGLQSVFYREGSSWKDAVAVIYVRVVHKDQTRSTVKKVISADVRDFMKQSSKSTVSESPPMLTRDKKKAVVKRFYDAANKNHESVAFIDEPKVVVVVALSSRDKDQFQKSLPDFKALVGSYFFVRELVDR